MARTTKPDTELSHRTRFPVADRRPQGSRESDPADLLDKTLAVWQPRTQRKLTREDAREIVSNVMGFFAVLDEWDRAERCRAPASDAPDNPVRTIRGAKRKRAAMPNNLAQGATAKSRDTA